MYSPVFFYCCSHRMLVPLNAQFLHILLALLFFVCFICDEIVTSSKSYLFPHVLISMAAICSIVFACPYFDFLIFCLFLRLTPVCRYHRRICRSLQQTKTLDP
jgi:hypothetical protein